MRAAPRSAETSGGSGKPRCTPPSPPVAIHRMPAARATASVPPTVVAPTAPCAAHARDRAGRPCAPRRRSGRARPRSSPTTISPSSTPIVAGTAPAARTCRSDSSPTATPSPGGKPCATSVVSSATTAATRAPRRRRGSRRPLHLDEARLLAAARPRGSRRGGTRAARARSTTRPRAGSASATTPRVA